MANRPNKKMQSTSKKTKQNAGETLVEVLASMFLFLIMFGILQGAVSYSSASMERNKKVRQENAAIIEGLQNAQETTSGSKNLPFIAVNSDFTVRGSQVFLVDTQLAQKQVTYQDTEGKQQTTTFYLYHAEQGNSSPATDNSPEVNAGE